MLTALRLYLRDAVNALADSAGRVADALDRLASREKSTALPGYTHMQQAMPSSVPLWAGGFAAEIRDDAEGIRLVQRRVGRNPLGSAAGYGTPGLPLDRALTTQKLGFTSVQEPVTSVQLSRGKPEASLLFEAALLMQDLGRFASDVLSSTRKSSRSSRCRMRSRPAHRSCPRSATRMCSSSSAAARATALACLHEALGICAKLPSGYQRDLQLLKVPTFRGIDIAMQTLDILPPAIDAMQFRPENIQLDPSIHAAEEANAMVVKEGIPFREALPASGREAEEDVRRAADLLPAPPALPRLPATW